VAAEHLDLWRDAGIRHYRLEFVHESPEQVTGVARAFASYFSGRRDSAKLLRELRRLAPEGTTQGSLFVPEGYLTLPVLQ
jgi:putative protease